VKGRHLLAAELEDGVEERNGFGPSLFT
jgi:hypothetical protein